MDIHEIRQRASADIESAGNKAELEAIKVKYLGRKQGEITALLKSLKDMSDEGKRTLGPDIQALKNDIESAIVFRESQIDDEKFAGDITIPGKRPSVGHLHILTQVEDEIRNIFRSMNFSVADGPELEEEFYAFDALNIPAAHPARDMWDTFWIKTPEGSPKKLLRPHTSPVQIRYMLSHNPPYRIISPGRTFRYEATDATHETNFYQLECLMIGKDVTLSNLKFVVEEFFRQFFKGKKPEVRFRSSYFPFVEPGVEIDLRLDGGKWMEVAGAGMVHPKVLEAVKIDSREWQGFAFGFGIERLAIIKYGIPDIRLFLSGDLRFTRKF